MQKLGIHSVIRKRRIKNISVKPGNNSREHITKTFMQQNQIKNG